MARVVCPNRLEPISKSLEEHRDAGELHKPDEIGGVVLPANQLPALPLKPGKEAFDEPAALIAVQVAPILSLELSSGAMRGNEIDAVLLKGLIKPVAVIGATANQMILLASSK